jgi:YD repeat-containing protein
MRRPNRQFAPIRTMLRQASVRRAMPWIVAVATFVPLALSAQQRPAAQTQRFQRTRDMHVACVGPDSARTFRRSVGDSLATGTARVTGGTPRSQSYPEYDVVLDIPNLCVERIFLKVDSVTAKLNLHAQVSNLVTIRAGADVLIGNVDLTIQDVRAKALLLVDLDDVVYIVDQTLTFIDNHPEIIQQLGSTLQNTGAAVGGVVGDVVQGVRGLLLGTTRQANGNLIQRIVNEATGEILERTVSSAGQQLAQRAVGSLLQLQTLSETTNAAGQAVRQVRDQAGALIEYTLDKATNAIRGVRLLQGR